MDRLVIFLAASDEIYWHYALFYQNAITDEVISLFLVKVE